jgi:hypothetical protein
MRMKRFPAWKRLLERASCGVARQTGDRQTRKRTTKWQSLLLSFVDEETGIVDKRKEAYYWAQKRETESRLEELKQKPAPVENRNPVDFAQIKRFLERLSSNWSKFSSTNRNNLLKLLIDKVELEGTNNITATIYWKTRFKQTITIKRAQRFKRDYEPWTQDEELELRKLYESSLQSIIEKAFPDRTWKSITRKAWRMGLRRTIDMEPAQENRIWTHEEDERLESLYLSPVPIDVIATELNRSVNSIRGRASVKKISRSREAKWHKSEISITIDNPISFQELSSRRD